LCQESDPVSSHQQVNCRYTTSHGGKRPYVWVKVHGCIWTCLRGVIHVHPKQSKCIFSFKYMSPRTIGGPNGFSPVLCVKHGRPQWIFLALLHGTTSIIHYLCPCLLLVLALLIWCGHLIEDGEHCMELFSIWYDPQMYWHPLFEDNICMISCLIFWNGRTFVI